MTTIKALARISTGEFIDGPNFDEHSLPIIGQNSDGTDQHDPDFVILKFPGIDKPPNTDSKRWDGVSSSQAVLRDETQAEKDARVDASNEAEAAEYTDATGAAAVNRKIFKSALIEYHAELQTIAGVLAGYTAPTMGAFRQRVIDRYKRL